MKHIGTEGAFRVSARARALEATGRDVIHLEIGEPDFDTPANIRDAAKAALDAGWTHYGPPLGLPELRRAIAADATARKGFDVDPGCVVVTPGAKPIVYFALLALVGPGDEVVCPDPGFPTYASMIRHTGAMPVTNPLRESNGFRMDPAELRSLVTERTRLVIFNSPHNPTGSVLTGDDLREIAGVVLEHDLLVLADEIYGRIVYAGEHRSIAALPGMAERTVILDGFSKTWAMTGWRLGYGIMPADLVPQIELLIINSVSCTSTFVQMAALEAITGPQAAVDAMVEEFRARRALLVDGLNRINGVHCQLPDGAFYAWPNIEGTGRTGDELADRLLYEGGVAVLPGSAFGTAGRHHLRVSYANSRDNLAEAVARMARVIDSLPRAGRA